MDPLAIAVGAALFAMPAAIYLIAVDRSPPPPPRAHANLPRDLQDELNAAFERIWSR